MEHMTRGGNDFTFVTGNYKLRTKARDEWLYVAGDEGGRQVAPPASDMGHGRVIKPIEELLRKPLAQAAKLTREEMTAIVMYTGPAFVLYNAVLRQFPADIYNVFKDGDNLFPTTIFVLVSAVNKLSRCMNIPPGTLLYRGLGGTLEFPDRFTRADPDCATPNALGFLEYGFMSTTAEKSVAVQYSGVKEGKPRAGILQISPNSVDRGADVSEFSQYPAEKEFLFVPYSFIQGEGRQRTEVVTGGGVLTVVPVRVNINLKTETVDELEEKKKRLHLVSARAMVEEVRYELGEWARSAGAAARLRDDPYHMLGSTPATLVDAIVQQCATVMKRHEQTGIHHYIDDGLYRALVSEILDIKAWAKEKKELWMQDLSKYIHFLQDWSLRECHRLWQSFLRRRIDSSVIESSERSSASLQLLKSQGLVKQSVIGETNADGEDVMVQAGADGWVAGNIAAAAAAGADIGSTDPKGFNGVSSAARFGHEHCLAALFAAGVNVNTCSIDGRSPIFIAAWSGQAACITQLVFARGDVNKCNNSGASPIWIAAINGHDACVAQLIVAGGDVNKCHNTGSSPINVAAGNGHAACVSRLISASANVNKCDNNGVSPIWSSALKGHTACIAQLISAGGDVNASHRNGASPIHIAAQSGSAGCLELLLASRADPRSSWKGTSALDAARQNNHTKCVCVLEAALA